jgi:hypothetical protein
MSPWLRDFIRRNIPDTVPPSMELCLGCRRAECSAVEFAQCAPRPERAAALRAEAHAASTASASRTTASSAPGAKGETSPAEATSAWNGAAPPRPQSAT